MSNFDIIRKGEHFYYNLHWDNIRSKYFTENDKITTFTLLLNCILLSVVNAIQLPSLVWWKRGQNFILSLIMTIAFACRGGGWMICNFSIVQVHFVFLLIEFHCPFPYLIKYYNIMIIIIVAFWSGSERPSGLQLLIRALFTSFCTNGSLLNFFCSCILFESCCSHGRVFVKTLVHEFPISNSDILNGTFFFRETTWSKLVACQKQTVMI